jgi:small subunit ribosomal protein S16
VAVKIKLKRIGKIRVPQYRIVIADSRTARNGRAIEEIGIYQPKQEPSLIRVDSERVQYWLSVGAQPTEPVLALLKVTGDWQKFKGLPGAEGTLKVAEPKADRKAIFAAAAEQAVGEKDRLEEVQAKAAAKAAAAREAAEAPADAAEAPATADAETPASTEGSAGDTAAVASDDPAPAEAAAPAAEAVEAAAADEATAADKAE